MIYDYIVFEKKQFLFNIINCLLSNKCLYKPNVAQPYQVQLS